MMRTGLIKQTEYTDFLKRYFSHICTHSLVSRLLSNKIFKKKQSHNNYFLPELFMFLVECVKSIQGYVFNRVFFCFNLVFPFSKIFRKILLSKYQMSQKSVTIEKATTSYVKEQEETHFSLFLKDKFVSRFALKIHSRRSSFVRWVKEISLERRHYKGNFLNIFKIRHNFFHLKISFCTNLVMI